MEYHRNDVQYLLVVFQVVDVVVSRLKRQGVLYNKDTKNFTKYQILMAKDEFLKNPRTNIQVFCGEIGLLDSCLNMDLNIM